MSQIEDLDAINAYIAGKKPADLTPAAIRLRDQWIAWFNDLGFWARNFDSNNYNIARNKKRAFDLANAKTAEERAVIKKVQAGGVTTEEMSGKPTILGSGGFVEEPKPLIPTQYKVAAAAAAGITLAGVVAKKLKLI
jgi:hypothetical protein